MKKVLILNPPGPTNHYINRDLMGGMGQKTNFGRDIRSKIISGLKSNFIHIPVVQLVYAATILAENNFEIKVIDAPNEELNLNQVLEKSREFNPDFIIMEVSSSCLIFERDVVAKKLKEILPLMKIITTGDTITHDTEQFKQPFDISIFGEVERVILDICRNEKKLSKITGIIYRNKNGDIIRNAEKKMLSNEELNNLPFPRWDLFPITKYVYYPLLTKRPVALVQSTRGCPYGCGYCSYPVNQGLKWRARSAENIVNELENDIKKYGIKAVFFRDPLFTLDKNRIKQICRLIKEKNLDLIFCFETRPELLTIELLDKLYNAGCRAINFGVEDIHPEILEKILRKPISTEKIKEIINYAEKIGIRTTCFFIIGLPGSTRQTIKETIDFSKLLNPSYADFKIATPYPGTYLHKLATENKWIVKEGYDQISGYNASMQISEELTPEFVEKTCKDAFNSYYLRFSYLKREIMRGTIIEKTRMIFSSLFSSIFIRRYNG